MQRDDGQTDQCYQTFGPEVPDRTQKPGKTTEIQNGAADGAQQIVTPHLSLRAAQHKENGAEPHGEAVDTVQHSGETGEAAAKRAQQVIQHADGKAQQDGLGKDQQLPRYLILHGYPNRRLKKPPRP